MQTIKQYDVFILSRDINSAITKGIQGVVLEIWEMNNYEVEFVKEDGTNYEFNGSFTFTIDNTYIDKIISTT